MATDLIVTKLLPPVGRATRVRRPQLENLLHPEKLQRLTLISAGAGFGKSTLMAAWHHHLRQQDMATAWISLDERDREPGQFLSYIIEALKMVGVIEGKNAESLLQNKRDNRYFSALAALINELAAARKEVVLFLDDYHFADNPDVTHLMESFISLAPVHFHFVLASRTKPHLPLATLKVHDELTEVSEKDLRFSNGEAAEFMQGYRGLNISEGSLERLIRSTEGWVAGLQLVSLAVRDGNLEENSLKQFSGNSRDVADFLARNVFACQPREIQRFMMFMAVPERFNADLCRWLTGRETAQEVLEYLEDHNLFITPLDQNREWFRYHHLFRGFLLNQLNRSRKNETARLKNKASRWFADAGLVVEAVALAHESGDYEYLADLVENYAESILIRGHMPLLFDWTKKIPPPMLQNRPLIPVYEGYALFHMRRPVEAAAAGYRAEEIIRKGEEAGTIQEDDLRHLKQEIKVIKAGVAMASDDVEQVAAYASVELDVPPGKGRFIIGAMKNMLGYALMSLNKFDEARQALAEARVAHLQGNSVYGVVYADCFSGIAEMALGHLQSAYDLFCRAEKNSIGDRLPNSPASAVSRLYRGLVCYEWGDLDQAYALITENIELVEECGQAEAPVMGYTALARICRARGEGDSVYPPLEAAHAICAKDQLHRLQMLTEYEYVRHLLSDGNLSGALSRCRRAGLNPEETESFLNLGEWHRLSCVKALTECRLLLASGQEGRAIEVLEHLEGLALAARRERRRLEILVLLARAHAQQGDREQALKILDRSLRLAHPEKYSRLFVDEGRTLEELLMAWLTIHAASDVPEAAAVREYVRHVLSGFGSSACPPQPPSPLRPDRLRPAEHILLEPLSEREIEVLWLLSRGYSNQKIGQDLAISENTVKWHIKNLFDKLSVKNRTSAVLAAQNLHLIPNS